MLEGTPGTVDATYKNTCSINTAQRSHASFATMCCHPHPALTCQNFAGSKLRAAHPDASTEGTSVVITSFFYPSAIFQKYIKKNCINI